MSLKVILLLSSFNRIVVVGFCLAYDRSSLRYLGTSAVSGMGSISALGLKSNQKVIGYSHNTIVSVYLADRSLL